MAQKIILASSSPRRIEMLRGNGTDPILIPPEVDETLPDGIRPRDAVMFLALKKALYAENIAIEKGYTNGEIIVAADTIVVCGDEMIGKPQDSKDAFEILKKLCGRVHTVFTGVAMIMPGATNRKAFYEKSDVYFKSYTDAEINAYVNTPEPYDKAGGYAVQGTWGKYISRIEGNLDNVIGLPLELVLKHLRDF
jgi:septum formation protein